MATVRTNPIVNGLSGMLGQTIVFKNLRGKTIMANRPSPPKKQSEQQKVNRSKFKEASHWAQMILLDAAKKEYYMKKAKKLKLPNAYTAAITDYMRKPRVQKINTYSNTVSYCVSKKDFELRSVEVITHDASGTIVDKKAILKDHYGDWNFKTDQRQLQYGIEIKVINEAGKASVFRLG